MRIPSKVLSHMDKEELINYSSLLGYHNNQILEMVCLLKEITRVLEDLRKMEVDFAEQKVHAADTNLEIKNFEDKIMKKYEEFMPVAINDLGGKCVDKM